MNYLIDGYFPSKYELLEYWFYSAAIPEIAIPEITDWLDIQYYHYARNRLLTLDAKPHLFKVPWMP